MDIQWRHLISFDRRGSVKLPLGTHFMMGKKNKKGRYMTVATHSFFFKWFTFLFFIRPARIMISDNCDLCEINKSFTPLIARDEESSLKIPNLYVLIFHLVLVPLKAWREHTRARNPFSRTVMTLGKSTVKILTLPYRAFPQLVTRVLDLSRYIKKKKCRMIFRLFASCKFLQNLVVFHQNILVKIIS